MSNRRAENQSRSRILLQIRITHISIRVMNYLTFPIMRFTLLVAINVLKISTIFIFLEWHKRGGGCVKRHTPPIHLGHIAWDNAAGYANIYRRHNLTQGLTAGLIACEVELSWTSQASRRLSAMKIFNVNIICAGRPAAYENQASKFVTSGFRFQWVLIVLQV